MQYRAAMSQQLLRQEKPNILNLFQIPIYLISEMRPRHQVKLRHDDLVTDILDAVSSEQHQDLTLYCRYKTHNHHLSTNHIPPVYRDGQFSCSTLLLVSLSPVLRGILVPLSNTENLSLSLPDTKTSELSDVFRAIYRQEKIIRISQDINELLFEVAKNSLELFEAKSNGIGLKDETIKRKEECTDWSPGDEDPEIESLPSLATEKDPDYEPGEVDERDDEVEFKVEIYKNQTEAEKDEEEFEVEKILEKRYSSDGTVQFLVKWRGWDSPAHDTWEKRKNLHNCLDLIKQFETDAKEKNIDLPKSKKKRYYNYKERPNYPNDEGPILFKTTDFSCNVCEVEFRTINLIQKHVYNAHGPHNLFRCQFCDKTFEQRSAHQSHVKKEHAEPTPCEICGKLVKKVSKSNHMRKHQVVPERTCEQCGRVFTNLVIFWSHQQLHKKQAKHGNPTGGIFLHYHKDKCQCDIKFASFRARKDHIKVVHMDYEICKICKKIVKDPDSESHTTTHNKTKKKKVGPCICKVCDKQCGSFTGLNYHMHTVHYAESHSCHMCGRVLKSRPALKSHIIRQHTTKERPCELCGKIIKNMRTHMRDMHAASINDFPYKCVPCNKGFSQKGKLEIHTMNIHLKLRPWKCRYGCKFAYNDKSNLHHHERKKHGGVFDQSLKPE